jgi:Mn2+/Fe2+ NRAMP family transporter
MILVVLMSVVFLVTAIIVQPDLGQMLAGIIPGVPDGSLITIVALIGTTVVPYNLFLHASAVQEKWSQSMPLDQALKAARRDTSVSISIGGLITLAVMALAATTFFNSSTTFKNFGEMSEQLEPLFGSAAKYFFATGLLSAGLTSAITAPLAAAYATAGVLGWDRDLRSVRFRVVWMLIVVAGTVLAVFAESPVAAILFAQAANGILLPLIAIFLLVVMNRKELLGDYTNGLTANLLGAGVVLIAMALGGFQLLKVFGAFF